MYFIAVKPEGVEAPVCGMSSTSKILNRNG